ncbi:M13 family metallopeptidase [Sphingomonas sp. NSE70-1]|uniref:M13 family metallopeptidase n=1 Tax=Sphingomonas caseinilyticus TaxID=2908205 RepID=A0ABT0RST0_9SPHN|nr:M13 family metallopeptidase [Sphingomonas caseinilyticus]MCL6698068.1 M13 family metallopeptidase [Sphingomonas caseinilyticus]
MRTKIIALLLASAGVAITASACRQQESAEAGEAAVSASGIDLKAMDKNVKPGDDFYAYANGGWMNATEIPADRSSVGGFYIADQVREKHAKELIDGILNSNPAAGSDEARIRDFYNAYLNTDAIDKAGMAPAKADLDAIAAIADKRALSAAIGSTLRADTDPLNATNFSTGNLFGIFVTQGLSTPGEQIPYLMQGGLGMPEREYYLSGSGDMAGLRGKYRTYVETVMKEAGNADPKAAADRIIALETKIAQAHVTRQESEDFSKGAKVWTRAELEKNAPGIDWAALLNAAQLGSAQKFQAYHAGSIPRLSALVASQPLDAWKDWLAFHTLDNQASVLPKAIRDASFAFNGTALGGATQQRPREALALNAVGNQLQDAVGKAYVAKYFPAESKTEIQGMVENIKGAFAKRVQALDWMAPSTKQEALKKVETIVVGVGYPDSWRNYSSLTISPTDAYANLKNAGLSEYRHQIAKIGKPMDRAEWWMPPQLVNAVNLPVQNALNFPAAILVRPFFDPKADAAFNYGAIGGVIGHEISHSFDNNGALFDSTGRLRNWWTPADFSKFQQSGDALAKQYDAYEPFPGLHVNGKLTLGENIADVAGLQAAYEAYRASLGGKEAPVLDGLTGDQRFFIAYAQSWATKMRDEALKSRIATDGHAPGNYRALTVRNIDAWYTAFNVKPGDKLYLAPEQRVKVW